MKKFTPGLIAVLAVLAFSPVEATGEINDNIKTEVAIEASDQEKADLMIDRL